RRARGGFCPCGSRSIGCLHDGCNRFLTVLVVPPLVQLIRGAAWGGQAQRLRRRSGGCRNGARNVHVVPTCIDLVRRVQLLLLHPELVPANYATAPERASRWHAQQSLTLALRTCGSKAERLEQPGPVRRP